MADQTKTIGTLGGEDYSTIQGFLDAVAVVGDISDGSGTGDRWIGELSDEDFDEDALSIGAGVTTDAIGYIILRAAASVARTGSGFDPMVANSGPRIRPTGTGTTDNIVGLEAEYTVLEDIEISGGGYTGDGTLAAPVIEVLEADCVVRRVAIRDITRLDNPRGILVTSSAWSRASAGSFWAIRVLVDNLQDRSSGTNARGILVDSGSSYANQFYIYNCTIYDTEQHGFSSSMYFSGSAAYLRNCISGAASTGSDYSDFENNGGVVDRQYCAAEDATADAQGGSGNLDSQTMTDIFTAPGSGDFTLKAGSNAIAAGEDLGTVKDVHVAPDGFDIDAGGGDWDMGVDHVSAAGGPASEREWQHIHTVLRAVPRASFW